MGNRSLSLALFAPSPDHGWIDAPVPIRHKTPDSASDRVYVGQQCLNLSSTR